MDASAWQPIDTAPKDGEILVYTPAWGAIIVRYSEEYGEWLSRMQVPVSIKDEADMPTHWQRLPDPPPGASEDEKGEAYVKPRQD